MPALNLLTLRLCLRLPTCTSLYRTAFPNMPYPFSLHHSI